MAFTLEHVEQVRNGFPRQVGQLPDDVWRVIGWPCPWVYLGKTGLEHIALRHPDVTDFDLLHIPLAIKDGLLIHVEKDVRQILIAYRNDLEKVYQCALKSAQSGTEIWVDSFYKIKPRRMVNLRSQGRVLREHL